MIKPMIMPKLGETVEEAKIVSWLKREGDWIDRGEPVFVAETDKVSIEVEALASGYLRRRLYGDGETVGVTLPIAYISDSLDEPLPDGATQPMPSVQRSVAEPLSPGAATGPSTPSHPAAGGGSGSGGAFQATPLARRMARERGIDLSRIGGTGPGGRITECDILAFVGTSHPAPERRVEQPAPLSTMRRRIGERMAASKATAPHFYLTARLDMSGAVALRSRLRQEGRAAPSYDGLVVAAVARALKGAPELNSSYLEGGIVVHEEVDVGVAVSLEAGLVVPVVRRADRLGALAITREVESLAERSRGNRLSPSDYEGGTFTISNLGMYPVDQFVAIINPPQAAILALGRIGLEPVAVETESGSYLGFAHLMHATLSVDHRIADGAAAARFLATVKELLEKPEGLVER